MNEILYEGYEREVNDTPQTVLNRNHEVERPGLVAQCAQCFSTCNITGSKDAQLLLLSVRHR